MTLLGQIYLTLAKANSHSHTPLMNRPPDTLNHPTFRTPILCSHSYSLLTPKETLLQLLSWDSNCWPNCLNAMLLQVTLLRLVSICLPTKTSLSKLKKYFTKISFMCYLSKFWPISLSLMLEELKIYSFIDFKVLLSFIFVPSQIYLTSWSRVKNIWLLRLKKQNFLSQNSGWIYLTKKSNIFDRCW